MIIMIHNHVSVNPTPSKYSSSFKLTKRTPTQTPTKTHLNIPHPPRKNLTIRTNFPRSLTSSRNTKKCNKNTLSMPDMYINRMSL